MHHAGAAASCRHGAMGRPRPCGAVLAQPGFVPEEAVLREAGDVDDPEVRVDVGPAVRDRLPFVVPTWAPRIWGQTVGSKGTKFAESERGCLVLMGKARFLYTPFQ